MRTSGFLLLLAVTALPSGAAAQQWETVVRIGEAVGAEEYTFGLVSDAAFGPSGEVFVLDAMNGRVRVYDLSGRHLRSFGRSGGGPGEFVLAQALVVGAGGITVLDSRQHRFVRFTHDGTHLETKRNPEAPDRIDTMIPLRHGYWLGAAVARSHVAGLESLVGLSQSAVNQRLPEYRHANKRVVLLMHPGAKPDTLTAYNEGSVWFVASDRYGPIDRPWGEGGCWTVSGDSLVAVVDNYTGQLTIRAIGGTGPRIIKQGRAPVTPKPLSVADWREAETRIRAKRSIPPQTSLIGPPFAAQISGCRFDDTGAVWLRMMAPEPSNRLNSRWLVVPADARPQRVVEIPSGFHLLAIRGDMLLGTRRGEYDTQYIEILRILWPAAAAPCARISSR